MSDKNKYNYCCVDCTCGKTDRTFIIEATKEETETKTYFCSLSEQELPLKLMGVKLIGSGTKMTKEQQTKVLKQRAHLDYKKNIEERKLDMHKKSGIR